MCDPCCPPACSPPACSPYCPPPSCDPCCPPPCESSYPSSCEPCCPSDYCDPCCPPPCPPKKCKSRELKGSVLITQCECVKRNGLQLDCPRTECHGRPCCTTKPWASCCPSKYMWRYTNVTMGKQTSPRPAASCRPKPVGGGCNPCVVKDPCCYPCD